MILRLLEPTDSLCDLTELIHGAYKELGDQGWNMTGVDQGVDVTRERIEEAECWVAIDTTRIVGTILVRPPNGTGNCPEFSKAGVAVINQLAVEPSLQGTGVGQSLIAQAERRAKEMGATEIALDTPEPAEFLVTWYQNQGYKVMGAVQWPGKSYRSAILAKSLL